MKSPEELKNILLEKFSSGISVISPENSNRLSILADVNILKNLMTELAKNEELYFDHLQLLSGIDDENGEKKTNEAGLVDIFGGTLSVVYNLESVKFKHYLTVKVSVPRENPIVPSVASIWGAADWHEREAYDMIGIIFEGHPDLKRILMPYDWEAGFPLRKDYKNPEFYHGMKVPY